MAKIIPFPTERARAQGDRHAAMTGPTGTILLFTGIRIQRTERERVAVK